MKIKRKREKNKCKLGFIVVPLFSPMFTLLKLLLSEGSTRLRFSTQAFKFYTWIPWLQ